MRMMRSDLRSGDATVDAVRSDQDLPVSLSSEKGAKWHAHNAIKLRRIENATELLRKVTVAARQRFEEAVAHKVPLHLADISDGQKKIGPCIGDYNTASRLPSRNSHYRLDGQ